MSSGGGTVVHAEEPSQAFTLDPMVVTAQRTETRDLDTPATTNIITEQNIKFLDTKYHGNTIAPSFIIKI